MGSRANESALLLSLIVGLTIAGAAHGAEPGILWSAGGNNGNKGEISFILNSAPGYFDSPLRVKLGRHEHRIAHGFMVGHGSGLEGRFAELVIREASCEPAALCRVSVVRQADTKGDNSGEVRVDFTGPGAGTLLVSGRSGVSFYSDAWPIAAEPLPDKITHDAGSEIVIPSREELIRTRVSKIVISVSASRDGRILRGPVSARIEDMRPPRGASLWANFDPRDTWRPCDFSSCPPGSPFSEPARARKLEITWRGKGSATLVLEAGKVVERIPIRSQD